MLWPRRVVPVLLSIFLAVTDAIFPEGAAAQDRPSTRAILTPESVANRASRTDDIALPPQVPPPKPRRVALVIGNSDYRSASRLANPRNDAEDMCQVLRQLNFDAVHCHLDLATRKAFREAIRAFSSDLGPQSASFFFYAGHGVQISGENYLLPVNVDASTLADVEDEGLNLGYLFRSLESARSAPNVVILDACRDNPFPKLRAWANTKGLARSDPPVGTVLVYATAPNGVALDGTGRNGVFTKHLLRQIGMGQQTLEVLFQGVARSVENEARSLGVEQIPYRSSSFSGQFCLAGCQAGEVSAEMEEIRRQSEEAAKRIKSLVLENAQLRDQASERRESILRLEARIQSLSRQNSGDDDADRAARSELERLRKDLARERSEQAGAERLKKEIAARDSEIAQLKERLNDLYRRSQQLETERELPKATGTVRADRSKPTRSLVFPSF